MRRLTSECAWNLYVQKRQAVGAMNDSDWLLRSVDSQCPRPLFPLLATRLPLATRTCSPTRVCRRTEQQATEARKKSVILDACSDGAARPACAMKHIVRDFT